MKKDLQDKLISGLIGAIIGGCIVYGYSYYITSITASSRAGSGMGRNFDPANMSDAQLQRVADRAGIIVKELKKRVAAGESMRDITGGSTGRGQTGSGTRSGSGAKIGVGVGSGSISQ